jgi:hypothetical protein
MNDPDLFTRAVQSLSPVSAAQIKRGRPIPFIVYEGETTRRIEPRGRDAWGLGNLLIAGAAGCTPIEHVGPRWSHYVWKLRTVYGLDIETIDEPHGGEFSGSHARYVLRSRVQFADPADAARHGGDR